MCQKKSLLSLSLSFQLSKTSNKNKTLLLLFFNSKLMTPQFSPMNPNSIKTRFTHRFLRALKRLRKNTKSPTAASPPPSFSLRYQTVKMAADASMAAAVGPRRVWSRAILRKVRSRGFSARTIRSGRRSTAGAVVRGIRRIKNGKTRVEEKIGFFGDDHRKTEELRRLVPGGEEAMDLYSLLDETAHYIKCLSTQVQVMRNIVDFCSPST